MPNTKNIEVLKDLEERKSRAKSVFLAEYTSLNSKQQTQLRSELKKAGGELMIAKNTLIARILGKEQLNQSLQGQTAALFSYHDEISALKALVNFIKGNEALKLKQGLVGDTVYDESSLVELSKLPGKEELIGMLLGRLNAPASKLVGVLTASQRNLVYVLQAITDKRGSQTA